LLVQQAQKNGAQLWESTEAVEPLRDDGWIRGATLREVSGDEKDHPVREVRARYVIAADGASSRFAQRVGVKRDASRPLGIAARRYYRSGHAKTAWLESWLDLWEGEALLPGYGWVFPLPDGTVNVGAGLLNTFTGFKDVSAQRLFDAFVHMLPESWRLSDETATSPVLSGPLPMGMNRRPLAMPGMLLVGDAGGL